MQRSWRRSPSAWRTRPCRGWSIRKRCAAASAPGSAPPRRIQVGALIGDAGWAVVALTGAALLLQHETVALALGLLGAGFLFHLARTALVSAVRGPSRDGGAKRAGGSLVTGVVFSVANPAGLAFWTGIGGGMLGTKAASFPCKPRRRFSSPLPPAP